MSTHTHRSGPLAMLRGMAERFEQVYSAEQRDAVAGAFNDRGIRPARRIAELAAAGELDGLDPFTIPVPTVLDLARKQRLRRGAEHTSELAKQPPRDAVEALRRRIVNVADRMVADLEKQPPGKVDPDRVRQAARAIRECAAIPGPTEPAPAKPGHTRDPNGTTPEGATRSGPVGDLLRAARQGTTAPDTDTGEAHGDQDADDTTSARAQHDTQSEDASTGTQPDTDQDQTSEHATPGEFARAQLARGSARSVVAGG